MKIWIFWENMDGVVRDSLKNLILWIMKVWIVLFRNYRLLKLIFSYFDICMCNSIF